MITPSKMVLRFFALLLLTIPMVIKSNAATFVPNSFTSMSGGATYCVGAVPANVVFRYGTCNSGGGPNVGISCTIKWYYNTTNSTNVGTATLVNTVVANSGTAAFGNTFNQAPLTTTQGTFFYFAVVTWAGGGTCNVGGTLAATTTTQVTVNAAPGAITGNAQMCTSGATIALTDAATGGTWTSGTPGVAAVNVNTGVVTPGALQGTTTITYNNACGAGTSITATVNATPAAITGNSQMCTSGSTISLANTSTNGTWTSSAPGVAGVNVNSGLVTPGAVQGTSTITYNNGCGSATTTATVNATPDAITGNAQMCTSGSTISLANTANNGTWTSSAPGVAGVNVNSGLVTPGASQGTTTISYANNCGSASTTATVNATPAAITGNAPMCAGGATITLANTSTNGTWSSSAPGVAGVNVNSGVVTPGAGAGTATISYSNGCGIPASVLATVGAPDAGTISGANGMCISTSTTLSDNISGGVWSSNNTSVATIDPSLGIVHATATPGSTVISYATVNSCGTATVTYVVNVATAAVVAPVTGPSIMCAGTFTILTDATAGGVWSASNSNATVNAGGLLTAITPGPEVISYTVTNACGPTSATLNVTIFPVLNTGTIYGPTRVCQGATAQLSDDVSGGVWSSSNTSVATITGLGLVSGITGGTTTISYLIISTCGSAAAVYSFTVDPAPDAGAINGASVVCTGASTVLSDAVAGGVWTSSNTSAATVTPSGVGAGTVYGANPGAANIIYSYTNICGTATTGHAITVSLPPNAGSISGLSSVCPGSSIQLSDNILGGAWSSSNSNVSVSGSGLVTGAVAGTSTISYTTSTACASATTSTLITINPLPFAGSITGPVTACLGSSVPLTDATAGGVWSSNNTSVATVDAFVNVFTTNTGVVIISYVVSNACGSAITNHTITVNPNPAVAPITGNSSVCVGSSVTLSDATSGGLWSNSNPDVNIFISGSGLVVTGISAGVVNISYAVTNGFGCTTTVIALQTVHALPVVSAIAGTNFGCVGGTYALSDATAGGVWSSSNIGIATVDAVNGTVSGITTGPFTVSYVVTDVFSCSTAVSVADTIHTIPSRTTTVGTMSVCPGDLTNLSNPASGGVWSNTTGNATVSATGTVTGVTPGTDYIVYAVSNACGTVLDSALVTVNPLPSISAITAAATNFCAGTSVAMSDAVSGGAWSTTNTSVAIVDATGLVTGESQGSAGIIYTVSNSFGCVRSTLLSVTIGAAMPAVFVSPGASATLCHGNPVLLQVSPATAGLTYQWTNNGTAITGATDSVYTADSADAYAVVIDNGTCNITLSGTNVIDPPVPVISFTAPDALYTGSFSTYQWFLNGVAIAGDTTSLIHETAPGNYTVVVADANGCSDTSSVFTILPSSVSNVGIAQNVRIYPNPASSVLHIDAPLKVNVSVLSVDGKLLISQKDATDIDVHGLATGMYMIMIYDQSNTIIKTAKFTRSE